MQLLKEDLSKSQERMKVFADKIQTEPEAVIGNLVGAKGISTRSTITNHAEVLVLASSHTMGYHQK